MNNFEPRSITVSAVLSKNDCRYYFIHHRAALLWQMNSWWRGVCVTGGWHAMWVCGRVQWQVCVFYRCTQKTHLEIHFSSKMQPHGVLCLLFTLTSKAMNVFILKITQRVFFCLFVFLHKSIKRSVLFFFLAPFVFCKTHQIHMVSDLP